MRLVAINFSISNPVKTVCVNVMFCNYSNKKSLIKNDNCINWWRYRHFTCLEDKPKVILLWQRKRL